MIKQIRVKDFQSHKDTTLELGRITVITGHSDAGKSALLRAVEALCFNQPGTAFVRLEQGHPVAQCTILLTTDDGAVLWLKTQEGAKYVLRERDKPDRHFTKLNRSMATEVTAFLGIDEILIDKDTSYRLQFGNQHELPFLVGDRGGVAAARVLGRLTGLNVFTTASRRVTVDKQATAAQLTALKQRETELQEQVGTYATDEVELKHLMGLRDRYLKWDVRRARAAQLQGVRTTLRSVQQAKASVQPATQTPDGLTKLETRLWRLLGQLTKITKLRQCQQTLASLRTGRAQWMRRAEQKTPNLLPVEHRLDRLVQLRAIRAHRADAWVATKAAEVADVTLTQFEQQVPLCPYVAQWGSAPDGNYRCEELTQFKRRTA